jgi:hypothetical protein
MEEEQVELLVEVLARKLEQHGVCKMHARLEELLEGARRGIELRARYEPKIGRRFLLQRREM